MPDERFDLFVSYAEEDRWWVEGFLIDALQAAGVKVHSQSAFRLGVPRIDEFERAVQASDRTLLVLSPAFAVDESVQFLRRLAQQYGADSHTWPVIPLMFKPVANMDASLRMLQGLDATTEAEWPEVVRRLCAELQHPAPRVAPIPPCPFPGMRAFRSTESGAFFARDADVRTLIDHRLRLHPFVAIVGASGTGKSSLAFAGLAPALSRSPYFGAGAWVVKSFRPGAMPMEALRQVFGDEKMAARDAVSAVITAAQSAGQADAARVLVIVDQFEELFTLALDATEAERTEFTRRLIGLSRTDDCYVVLTVRADFYADLMRNGELWNEIKAHRLELTPLDEDGLREAITRPAEGLGVEVEPALVERLLADCGTEPGILPFLQETMVLLWSRIDRKALAESSYDAIVEEAQRTAPDKGHVFRSGLDVAMASRADQTMAALGSEEARGIARRILLRLVQFGEGRADTRRQQTVAKLRSANDDPGVFEETLRQLIDARLLTISGEEGRSVNETPVDIAHEALLTGWPSLAEWIGQRRDGEQTRRWLRQVADKWLERKGEVQRGGLLDEVELAEAERWQERFGAIVGRDAEIEKLIAESRKQVDARRREEEEQRRRELQQQAELAEAQRLRAEEAERFAEDQRQLNAELQALNLELKRSAANNAFVQSMGLIEADKADRAMARLAQTLSLDPSHAAAGFSLYNLLTRRWHPRRLASLQVDGPLERAVYSADGGWIAGYGRRETHVWRVSGEDAATVLRHPSAIQSVQFSRDATKLLTASTTFGEAFGQEARQAEGTIELWELAGNRLASGKVAGMVTAAIFGGREKRVYVASAFGPEALTPALKPAGDKWTNDIEREKYRTDNTFSLIAYHSEENRIAWVGSPQLMGPGELYVWDEATGKLLVKTEEPGFNALMFGRDGKSVIFSGPMIPGGMRGLGHRPKGFAGVMDLEPAGYRGQVVQHEDEVTCLRVNDAYTRAVTTSLDNFAKLWVLHSGRVMSSLRHDSAVTAAAFSPAGNLLVTGSVAGAVRVWNGYSGEALSEIAWHDAEVASIAFHPSGAEFLVAMTNGWVHRYDAGATVSRQNVLETGQPRMERAWFLGETDPRVMVRSEDRCEVWDALAGVPLCEFLNGNKKAKIGAVAAEQGLAAVLDGNRVRVFRIDSGKEEPPGVEHEGEVREATLRSGGRLITVSDKKVVVETRGSSQAPRVFAPWESTFVAAREMGDGQLLLATTNTMRICDVASSATVDEFAHDVQTATRTLDSNSQSFVVEKRLLSIVDAIVYEELNRALLLFGYSGAFVGQPRYKDGFVVQDAQLWSLRPLRPLAPPVGGKDPQLRHDDAVNNAVLLPQTQRAVTTSNDGTVRIWSSETGALLFGPMPHEGAVYYAVPSPDQQMVAVYGRSNKITLWNVETGEQVGRALAHVAPVKHVKFLGKTTVLAAWADNGLIQLWDVVTGLELPDVVPTGPNIRSADVGLGGDLVLTVNDPGVASIYRVGQTTLFAASLDWVLALTEAVCGWTVTKQGIETRRVGTSIPVAGGDTEWSTFSQWLDDDPRAKACFSGSGLSSGALFRTILAIGPSALAWVVLQNDPANPEVVMLLAETVARMDQRQIQMLAGFIAASEVQELASAALNWADLAVRLAGGDKAYKLRAKRVAVACAKFANAVVGS